MSFYDKIKDQVTELTNKYNYQNDGTAFGHFIIKECFNKIIDFDYDGTDFDDFIKEHMVDMSNDLGNDAVFTNEKNNEILIFQFKFSNSSLLNNGEIPCLPLAKTNLLKNKMESKNLVGFLYVI